MAELSNQLLVVAVLGYLAAMLGHLMEYAFGDRGPVARAAAPRQRELVGAGASTAVVVDGSPIVSSQRPRVARFGAIAVVLTVAAVAAHAGVLLTRGLAAGRVPWGNMYEFVLALSLVGAVGWLVLLARRPALRLIGLFVTLALVLVLGFAGMVLYTSVAPLVPALNSYWLKIHVTAAATASGLLLLGFVPAALFLVRSGYDAGKRRFPYPIGEKLPAADALERLTFRLHAFAFPIWTFAVICGAIWAESAWGRYWGWDPKETWAFITWMVLTAYLHARATAGWKGRKAAYLALLAYGTFLFNYLVVNIWLVGFHSYAGVS
jgi:cytochrome c-type biogenesis protein CcsB